MWEVRYKPAPLKKYLVNNNKNNNSKAKEI